jgi:hypothetical protein
MGGFLTAKPQKYMRMHELFCRAIVIQHEASLFAVVRT